MSKNPTALILLLTLLTIVVFVVSQVARIVTTSTIPAPTQQQMEKLDPNLDKNFLEELKKATESANPK